MAPNLSAGLLEGGRSSRDSTPSVGSSESRQKFEEGRPASCFNQIEAFSQNLTSKERAALFLAIFIVSFGYGLDGSLRFTYQNYATASYMEHSLLARVNVARSVIASGIQPLCGRISDVFGRLELVIVSVILYVAGTLVQSVSTGVECFSVGSIVYQLGYTMILLMVEVILADITSTRSRLLFSYIPSIPFLVNGWISGYILQYTLEHYSWRFGIGIWCVLYTCLSIPLIIGLIFARRRTNQRALLKQSTLEPETSFKTLTISPSSMEGDVVGLAQQEFRNAKEPSSNRRSLPNFANARAHRRFHWARVLTDMDIVGSILLTVFLSLVLVPLAGHLSWRKSAGPIASGVVALLGLVLWEVYLSEKRKGSAILPPKVLKNRSVWTCLGIALLMNTAWYLQGDYLYTVLIVAFDFSVLAATRIQSLYSFTSVCAGTILGLVVYRVRRLKWFIVSGCLLFMVAYGLLVYFRRSYHRYGIVLCEVLLGVAGGMIPFPAQASIQAAASHKDVAVVTGLFLACYNIGSAIGASVSGAIWAFVLPRRLDETLAAMGRADLAKSVFEDPFTIIASYPFGTETRFAIVTAYQEVQKVLCLTGLLLCVPLVICSFSLKDPLLNDAQALVADDEQLYHSLSSPPHS